MMTHTQALNHLDELFDGELPPALAAEVDRHVQACSHCQAAMARRAALSRSFSGVPARLPSTTFVQSVMRRISADRVGAAEAVAARTRGFDAWVMPSLAAGLAVAVLLIGFGVKAGREESAAVAADPIGRIEQESAASLSGVETSRAEDVDQAMLVAMGDE